jgi:cobalamin synthase
MGVSQSFQFTPIHAHLNLLGWASLAMFGLIYKSYPELAKSRLAMAHFALSSLSSIVFPLGLYLAIAHANPLLAVAASFLALGGVLVFFTNLVRVFFGATGDPAGEDRIAV